MVVFDFSYIFAEFLSICFISCWERVLKLQLHWVCLFFLWTISVFASHILQFCYLVHTHLSIGMHIYAFRHWYVFLVDKLCLWKFCLFWSLLYLIVTVTPDCCFFLIYVFRSYMFSSFYFQTANSIIWSEFSIHIIFKQYIFPSLLACLSVGLFRLSIFNLIINLLGTSLPFYFIFLLVLSIFPSFFDYLNTI